MADIRVASNPRVTWRHRQRSREMAQHEFPLTPFFRANKNGTIASPVLFFISFSAGHTSHSSCREIIKQDVRARGWCDGVRTMPMYASQLVQ